MNAGAAESYRRQSIVSVSLCIVSILQKWLFYAGRLLQRMAGDGVLSLSFGQLQNTCASSPNGCRMRYIRTSGLCYRIGDAIWCERERDVNAMHRINNGICSSYHIIAAAHRTKCIFPKQKKKLTRFVFHRRRIFLSPFRFHLILSVWNRMRMICVAMRSRARTTNNVRDEKELNAERQMERKCIFTFAYYMHAYATVLSAHYHLAKVERNYCMHAAVATTATANGGTYMWSHKIYSMTTKKTECGVHTAHAAITNERHTASVKRKSCVCVCVWLGYYGRQLE